MDGGYLSGISYILIKSIMLEYILYFGAVTLLLYFFKSPHRQNNDAPLINYTPPRMIKRKVLPPIKKKQTPESDSSSSSDYMQLIPPEKLTFQKTTPAYPLINQNYMLWDGQEIDIDDPNK